MALRLPASFRSRGNSLHAALSDPLRYRRQIDHLHQRHLFDSGMRRLRQDDISLGTMVMQRETVARLLSRAVAAGEYQVGPAMVHTIRVNGKPRAVFEFALLDRIVHGVVADVLSEAIEPLLASSLHSYRSGFSWWRGVAGFAAYVRAHRRERPDPLSRGLYVLRRDIDAYTDSIPLGPESAIWSQLAGALESRGWGNWDSLADRLLIESIVRPAVRSAGTAVEQRERGVATGLPISCVCFNLFLAHVDRELQAIPGGFWARYSDDMLFAHPDPDVCREASALLDRRVADLGLRFNAEKRQDLYLTGAGRRAVAWPEARPATGAEFLGMRVMADGSVALGERKVRDFLREARRRARNAADAAEDRSLEARGRAVVSAIRRLLDADDADLQAGATPLLAHAVTDRRQLDALDHELAAIVAATVSGRPAPAAFRAVRYRHIRTAWGLPSLRRRRDRAAGGR